MLQTMSYLNKLMIRILDQTFFIIFLRYKRIQLGRTYKPHYDYQNFSPLANETDLNRQKYAILQTHWH